MSRLSQSLTSLFSKKERFVVLEIFSDYLRITYGFFDPRAKQLVVTKIFKARINGLAEIGAYLNKIRIPRKSNIILALGSAFATTLYSSSVLIREKYSELIDEPDLDNLVSQAIWKFFDRHRNQIAQKMQTSDLDVILTDVRIRGIKLDSHKVVNPLGFKARSVEVSFSQTFLTREFTQFLKQALPINQIVFVTEAGSSWSHALSSVSPKSAFLLGNVLHRETELFISDGRSHGSHDTIQWGLDVLPEHLSDRLAVEGGVAREIITRYLNGKTSILFRRRLETIILEAMHNLLRGFDLALERTGTSVLYVYSYSDLPPLIFTSHFRNRFKHSVNLYPVVPSSIGENFGFRISFKEQGDTHAAFPVLSYFLDWRLGSVHSKLEQIAKRRVRWLSPL